MAKVVAESPTKWEIRFEDETGSQVWKFDRKRNRNGPVSVDTVWKQWLLDEWENNSGVVKKKIKKRK